MEQLALISGVCEPDPSRAAPASEPAGGQLALFEPPPPGLPRGPGSEASPTEEPDPSGEGEGQASLPESTRLGARARPTIRGQVRVETLLRHLLGPRILVRLTENRTTMISFSVKKGVTYLRLHAIFAEAPDHVLGAVARFVACPRPGPKVAWLIDQWIEAHRHLVKTPDRAHPALPRGEVHDLQRIYDALNRAYFGGRVDARVTWSVAARRQKRSSIRLGSYNEEERLIRIHPALDQGFVPEYFVASVVFHEMLHQLHGAHEGEDGTRRVHTPAFRRDEARFRDFARARAWETQNLRRLLRY